MRTLRLILLALAIIAGGAALGYRALRPLEVATARVARGSAIDAVYASGPVEAVERVEVKARVSGPVGPILVRAGQTVSKGQLLTRIDAPALGYEVARGRADLRAARDRASTAPQVAALEQQTQGLQAQLEQARRDAARAEQLASGGAGTRLELERARTPVSTLEAQIAANRAQQADLRIALRADAARTRAGVASLRARAADAGVYSPMDGVVLFRHVEPGQMVAPNENLLRIGDVRHLWIEARVDEADIGRVRAQMPAAVRLYAFPGGTFRGQVARLLPEADRERKSFEVDIELREAVDGLRPGMTAEINIITQQHEGALLLPADAVREGHVWVAKGGRLLRREVELGIRDLTRVEVLRGLSENELVVLEEEGKLREGLSVSPREATPPRAGG